MMITEKREAGKHGWRAYCHPTSLSKIPGAYGFKTFSIGIFEWVPAVRSGTKASKVKVRVRCPMDDPEAGEVEANRIVAELDAGTYDGPRSVVLR